MAKKKQKFDEGYEATEELLEQLERRIQREYKKAADEIADKCQKYWEKYKVDLEKQKSLLEAGKITERDFNDWKIRHLGMGQHWEEMRKTIAEDFQNADLIARNMVSDTMKDVYALNHNFATYQIMHDGKLSWSYSMYDKNTVERLLKDGQKLYPDPGKALQEKIDNGEVLAWNEKEVQSSLLQSILQGDDMNKAAERLGNTVAEKNMNVSLRNARTMITGAQNAGRMDGFHDAQEMGIRMKKKWIATLDDKTRHTHRQLHGVVVDVDEPFETEDGDIMFPGDFSADASLVYNCRCSIESVIEGFERETVKGSVMKSDKSAEMTFEEWQEGGK